MYLVNCHRNSSMGVCFLMLFSAVMMVPKNALGQECGPKHPPSLKQQELQAIIDTGGNLEAITAKLRRKGKIGELLSGYIESVFLSKGEIIGGNDWPSQDNEEKFIAIPNYLVSILSSHLSMNEGKAGNFNKYYNVLKSINRKFCLFSSENYFLNIIKQSYYIFFANKPLVLTEKKDHLRSFRYISTVGTGSDINIYIMDMKKLGKNIILEEINYWERHYNTSICVDADNIDVCLGELKKILNKNRRILSRNDFYRQYCPVNIILKQEKYTFAICEYN